MFLHMLLIHFYRYVSSTVLFYCAYHVCLLCDVVFFKHLMEVHWCGVSVRRQHVFVESLSTDPTVVVVSRKHTDSVYVLRMCMSFYGGVLS